MTIRLSQIKKWHKLTSQKITIFLTNDFYTANIIFTNP